MKYLHSLIVASKEPSKKQAFCSSSGCLPGIQSGDFLYLLGNSFLPVRSLNVRFKLIKSSQSNGRIFSLQKHLPTEDPFI